MTTCLRFNIYDPQVLREFHMHVSHRQRGGEHRATQRTCRLHGSLLSPVLVQTHELHVGLFTLLAANHTGIISMLRGTGPQTRSPRKPEVTKVTKQPLTFSGLMPTVDPSLFQERFHFKDYYHVVFQIHHQVSPGSTIMKLLSIQALPSLGCQHNYTDLWAMSVLVGIVHWHCIFIFIVFTVPVSEGHLQGGTVGLVLAEGHADLLWLSFTPIQGSWEALVSGLQPLQTPAKQGDRHNNGTIIRPLVKRTLCSLQSMLNI